MFYTQYHNVNKYADLLILKLQSINSSMTGHKT